MSPSRHASLVVLALVAAAGCGKSRGTAGEAGTVTMPQADGTSMTVDTRFCVRCHGDLANATATTDAAGVQFTRNYRMDNRVFVVNPLGPSSEVVIMTVLRENLGGAVRPAGASVPPRETSPSC